MKNDKKIVKTRQSLDWNLVFYYLQLLSSLSIVMIDEDFHKMYDDMCNYVSERITPPYDADVKDTYVIVEQEVTVE